MSRKTILIAGGAHTVDVTRQGDDVTATVDDVPMALTVRRDGNHWRVGSGEHAVTATVVRDRDTVWIAIGGEIHRCTAADDARAGGAGGGVYSPKVTAPMPGKVLEVRVVVGQELEAGDPLVLLEAMKMETVVSADAKARVTAVHVAAGAMVEPGQVLVVLEFAKP